MENMFNGLTKHLCMTDGQTHTCAVSIGCTAAQCTLSRCCL